MGVLSAADEHRGTVGTRTLIYLHHDPAGHVEDYVPLAIGSMRYFVDRVLVVVNGPVSDDARQRLTAVADDVLVRENEGFDVGGYLAGLRYLGWEAVAGLEGLVLTNNTFFAPVAPWGPVLEAAAAQPEASFWGLSEHAELRPHPFLAKRVMPRHLQSHFLVVRPRLLADPAFRDYWETMPPIESYKDSVAHHESRFTEHFHTLGHASFAVFPLEHYRGANPSLDDAGSLLADGCPALKRRLFFHDPLYLDHQGVSPAAVLADAVDAGYPEDVLLGGLVRTSAPRTLVVNAGLTETLTGAAVPVSRSARPVNAHALVTSPDEAACAVARLAALPDVERAVIACADGPAHAAVDSALLAAPDVAARTRVVDARRPGLGALASLLLDAADLLTGDGLLLRLAVGEAVRNPDDDALAGSAVRLAEAAALFETHASLGLVLPVLPVVGSREHGHGWAGGRSRARALARRAGIRVPLDAHTPLAAYGRSCLLRPSAATPLTALVGALSDADALSGSGVGETLEGLLAPACLSAGLHCRQVLGPADARAYGLLEHRYQALAALLPASPFEQVPHLAARSGPRASLGAVVRRDLERRAPGLANSLKPVYRIMGGAAKRLSSLHGRSR
ncbi:MULTISPECIES: rhamnan synthesis F family protein [Actinomyces]|uniref:Rhamnan synthesis protein F n=1 Tax=Actinomyces respiraculi TaxID=2744574 RepID=A0A7T0LLI1_9ACTO|nr:MULTISPECIES: rhamnan synthesis F family protein [Actinomyces]QPL05817.1 rhamnan synthesis protein F [Actinomyces respiraculi]